MPASILPLNLKEGAWHRDRTRIGDLAVSSRFSEIQGVKWRNLVKILDNAEQIILGISSGYYVLERGLKIRASVVRFCPGHHQNQKLTVSTSRLHAVMFPFCFHCGLLRISGGKSATSQQHWKLP